MTVTIYHNPRCSKSRQTLSLLEDKGIVPNVVLYLETPPNALEIAALLNQLDLSARQLMRKGEQEYKDLQLNRPDLTEDQLITMMCQYPKLIERPIVATNGKAKIGRPPESVLEIL